MPDQGHVGRRYEAPGQVVDGEAARRFAAAIAGADPVVEPDAVPPTFAAVYCLFPTLGQVFLDPEVGINLAGLVHGEQAFTWHRAVRAGDVLDCACTIASVEEKRGMTFVGVDIEATEAGGGAPVLEGRALLLIRGGGS